MAIVRCSLLLPRRVGAPVDSLIADWYPAASLLDTYAVPLEFKHADLRELARRMLERPPWWFRLLLGLRDVIMGAFGVKTTAQVRAGHDDEHRLDFFPLLDSATDELILGEDDRHLDFRLSLKLQRNASGPDVLMATTAVRCHNGLGRAYIGLIHPFHIVVVRSHLARAARLPKA